MASAPLQPPGKSSLNSPRAPQRECNSGHFGWEIGHMWPIWLLSHDSPPFGWIVMNQREQAGLRNGHWAAVGMARSPYLDESRLNNSALKVRRKLYCLRECSAPRPISPRLAHCAAHCAKRHPPFGRGAGNAPLAPSTLLACWASRPQMGGECRPFANAPRPAGGGGVNHPQGGGGNKPPPKRGCRLY